MKKNFLAVTACLVLLAGTACTTMTTSPSMYTVYPASQFEILGEIRYESSDRIGYIELLRVARNLYPECDYVIDIMIDERLVETTFPLFTLMLPWMKPIRNTTWVMRGTAVRYVR